MSISDFVKTNCHGQIVLSDGTGTPVTLTVPYDLGDVQISNLAGVLNAVKTHERRGGWLSDSYGERLYPQITFTCYHTSEGASAPGSVQAFLFRTMAPYTANVSVQGAGRVYAVDFELIIEGTDFGDAGDWDTTFANCVPDPASFGESADGDSWSFSLTCKGAISGSLVAAEYA